MILTTGFRNNKRLEVSQGWAGGTLAGELSHSQMVIPCGQKGLVWEAALFNATSDVSDLLQQRHHMSANTPVFSMHPSPTAPGQQSCDFLQSSCFRC